MVLEKIHGILLLFTKDIGRAVFYFDEFEKYCAENSVSESELQECLSSKWITELGTDGYKFANWVL